MASREATLAPDEAAGARRARLLNRAGLALALLWVALIGLTLAPDPDDFQYYWQGAAAIARYGDPYFLIHGNQPAVAYVYPPLFAYLILPLGWLPLRAAQLVWFGLNVLMLAALLATCVRLSGSALARRYWGVLALLALLAPPTRLSLQLGQVSILMALVMLGALALARRRPWASAALLALAALVKIYPAALSGYFLLRRRGVLARALVAGALLVALSLLVHGPAPYSNYLSKVVLGRDYPYFGEHNISLYGFWGRLLTASDYGVPIADVPWLARLLTLGCAAAALALCAWASRGPTTALAEQLRFGAWLCAMMLISPSNGAYTFVVLLLPLLGAARALELRPDRRARAWLVVGAALVCWPPAWTDWQPWLYNRLHIGFGLLLLTPAFYGLLLCTGLLAWLARREQAPLDANSV